MSRFRGSSRAFFLVLVGSLAGALLVGPVSAAGELLGGDHSVRNARDVTAVRTVSASGAVSNDARLWADVPGMSHTVGVPGGERARLLVTFSAAVRCGDEQGSSGPNTCYIRVLVDGLATVAPDFVIFTEADNALSWETHSMQFVSEALPAGVHTVTVQFATSEFAPMELDARTLTILRAYVPA